MPCSAVHTTTSDSSVQRVADGMSLTSTVTNPLAGPSALRDLIRPQFHQNNFAEELYVKNELGIKLDKGQIPSSSPDRLPTQ